MVNCRTPSIWAALGLLGLFASFVGCSGSVQNGGGGPNGTPTGCDFEGKHYAEGDNFIFIARDACNHCSCSKGGDVACTLANCDPRTGDGSGCVDAAGVHYAPGQSFPSSDGCNSCFCSEDGQIACTARDCEDMSCGALVKQMQATLTSVQKCQSAADCGQRIPNSSCGCTRDLIARKDADLTEYLAQRADVTTRGCDDLGGSVCDCPNADGFACVNQVCTWNYVNVEPTCEPYDAAELCVRGTQIADGEQISAGDPLQVTVRSAGCLSSSCSKVVTATCSIASSDAFRVDANFCVANTAQPGQGCTADCGTAHADCSFGQPLTAGEHQVKLGSIAVGFQVPSKLPPGGLCASAR